MNNVTTNDQVADKICSIIYGSKQERSIDDIVDFICDSSNANRNSFCAYLSGNEAFSSFINHPQMNSNDVQPNEYADLHHNKVESSKQNAEADDSSSDEPLTAPSPTFQETLVDVNSNEMDPILTKVAMIQNMGFSDVNRIKAAILISGSDNLDEAVDVLLEKPGVIDKFLESQNIIDRNTFDGELGTKMAKLGSWIVDRATSGLLGSRSTSPQKLSQDSKLQNHDDLNSSAARGSHDESFGVTFGTHVQTTRYLRLICTDSLTRGTRNDGCVLEWPENIAERKALLAQTLATLVSPSGGLVGLIRIQTLEAMRNSQFFEHDETKRFDFNSIDSFKFSDEFWGITSKSPELVFEDAEVQFQNCLYAGFRDPDSNININEGDFVITKHSNIPGIHIVFHLFIENASLVKEWSQESPILVGTKKILDWCHEYGVKELLMPMLMIPDMSHSSFKKNFVDNFSEHDGYVLRQDQVIGNPPSSIPQSTPSRLKNMLANRAETILKLVKSTWIENFVSRGDQIMDEQGISNIGSGEFMSLLMMKDKHSWSTGLEIIKFWIPKVDLEDVSSQSNQTFFQNLSLLIRRIFRIK